MRLLMAGHLLESNVGTGRAFSLLVFDVWAQPQVDVSFNMLILQEGGPLPGPGNTWK